MAAARRVPTKQGGRMLFLTLDDGTGLAECTLFPDAYARAQPRLAGAGPFTATGRVESQYGAVTVNVETVEPWDARSGDQRRQVLVGRDARPAGRMEESRWLRQAP